MKLIILLFMLLIFGIRVEAEEKPKELYAQSAVLMDADTGRILFEKDAYTQKAMASTTKIMTCILVLEEVPMDTVVTFSKNAASQPKVHLGANEGEQFYIEDLLYSLMLESHNDVAVAIAETVAGSVESFAKRMNQKAIEIGCKATYFITPNGLDAQDEYGFHSTSAEDLARIMSYCINKSSKKDEFLAITGKKTHTFSNIENAKQYTCYNRNSYLDMREEAISGKTGYTGKAGYCYVGAVESEGRTFVVSLLASGWPNHKDYKWKDMNKIIDYALEEFELQEIEQDIPLKEINVSKGIAESLFQRINIPVGITGEQKKILLGKEETLEQRVQQIEAVEAPVEEGEQVGSVLYTLHGEKIAEYPIVSMKTVKRIDFFWIFSKMMELYLI